VAWLSTSSVNARDRLKSPVTGATANGWIRPDRRPFAVSLQALLSGQILYPVRLDERGRDLFTGPDSVATGTGFDGVAGDTAADWTASTKCTQGNLFAGPFFWTTGSVSASGNCANVRIYCFGTDLDRPVPVGRSQGRLAFVSSGTFSVSGGVAAADALCQQEAVTYKGNGLPVGTYLALLSTTSRFAADRFSDLDKPWVRVDGLPWALDLAHLKQGDALTQLLDPTGASVGTTYVWTGSDRPGVAAPADCAAWMSNQSGTMVITGRGEQSGPRQFHDASRPCSETQEHLYCLQN
jgi:hypothetical protein